MKSFTLSHRAPAFLQYLTNAEHLTPNIFQYSILIHFNALASPKETDHVAPPLNSQKKNLQNKIDILYSPVFDMWENTRDGKFLNEITTGTAGLTMLRSITFVSVVPVQVLHLLA